MLSDQEQQAIGWSTLIAQRVAENRAGRISCLDEGLARAVLSLAEKLESATRAIIAGPHAITCAALNTGLPCDCWIAEALAKIGKEQPCPTK